MSEQADARLTALAVLALLIHGMTSCHSEKAAAKPEPQAKVSGAPKEAELARVTLTEKAEERLGIRTVPVERRSVPQVRRVGGEIVVPPGQSITVSAPVAGTVLAADAMPLLHAGADVGKGDVVLQLVPLPAAADFASLGGRLEDARRKAARAKQMLDEGAASRRDYEAAESELEIAEANAEAARPDRAPGKAAALSMRSPREGILRASYVAPGQAVAAGAALFLVEGVHPVWVQVPLYVGDVDAVERSLPARVRGLSAAPDDEGREASVAPAPRTANPRAASADLYFELANEDGAFVPGQRVSVVLPLRSASEDLAVPRAAILHDVHGGSWVYATSAPHVFERQRVEVAYVSGDTAVLAAGPEPGTQVVTTGAAELFGTEFGTGK